MKIFKIIIGAFRDLHALATIRAFAKEYSFVELTFSDCGCHRIELWQGNVKIAEEDKDLATCVRNLVERLDNQWPRFFQA
jgi:hypothetical protein